MAVIERANTASAVSAISARYDADRRGECVRKTARAVNLYSTWHRHERGRAPLRGVGTQLSSMVAEKGPSEP
jgi:hypothetical protein